MTCLISKSNTFLSRLATAVWIATIVMVVSVLATPAANAQDLESSEVVIFVLDLSGSMNESFDGEQTKLDAAKAAFVEAFANISPDAQVGLRTYGDQIAPTAAANREAGCTTDTQVASPPASQQQNQLISQVEGFTALGDTPIGLALRSAASDIPAGATGTIVLFSDGRDECFDADLDGDPASGPSFGEEPCAVAQDITAGESAVDRVVTVGFSADAEAERELRCIAESTGGTYNPIQSPEDARNVLPELLVQLSAPREAQRLLGLEIQGTTEQNEDTPDFQRLDEAGVTQILYTDTIDMNSNRVYRFDDFGPDAGTLTATVFGLPAEDGIVFDLAAVAPGLGSTFFQGEHADTDAGLPFRQTASIRCPECAISGGPHEVFWVLSLTAADPALTGTYELEILTEGLGFGGDTTSCSAPQACFYPQEIVTLTERLEQANSLLEGDTADVASEALIAQRETLRNQIETDQDAITASNARSDELEALIATAPSPTTSIRLPLLMILGGLFLAFAPIGKFLRRKPRKDGAEQNLQPTHPGLDPIAMGSVATAPGQSLPDQLGSTPAVSPALQTSGNNWDDELEAAKAALAEQRPERVGDAASGPSPSSEPSLPGGFTPEQHAAAKAAAEQIAAEKQAVAGAMPPATSLPAAASEPTLPGGFTPEQHAAAKAAAEQQQAAAQQAADAAAQQAAAAEQAAASAPPTLPGGFTPEQHAAAKAAAEQQQAAAQQAADAAEQAAAEQMAAEKQAAAQQAADEQQAAARRAAAEQMAANNQAAAQQQAVASQESASGEPASASTPKPGWYGDPSQPGQFRWWDGTGWTEHTRNPATDGESS